MRIAFIAGLALVSASTTVRAQSPVEQAQKLFDAQKYAEAQQILVPLGNRDAAAALLLGKIALHQDDATKSVDWLEKSVTLNPRSSEACDWLGKAYGTQAQRASKFKQPFLASKTKSAWEKAIALDPNNIEARADMIQYYLQAPGFLGGSKAKAKQEASEIRARSPYRGAFVAANVCVGLKDLVCAENELKALIAAYPDSSSGYSSLAAVYANAKQYDKAFAMVEVRLKTKPSDPASMYSFGRTASISGLNLDRGEQ